MQTFTSQRSVSAVKRLSYSGGKGTYSAVSGATYSCYLHALSEKDAAVNAMQWGTAYAAIFELGADIRKADILTIDSVDYTVQGVATYSHGNAPRRTDYIKVLLVLKES